MNKKGNYVYLTTLPIALIKMSAAPVPVADSTTEVKEVLAELGELPIVSGDFFIYSTYPIILCMFPIVT
jgi:hypothetical protein